MNTEESSDTNRSIVRLKGRTLQLIHIKTIKPRHKAVVKNSEVQKSVKKFFGGLGFSFSEFGFSDSSNITYEKSKESAESIEESFEIQNKFDTAAHIHAIFELQFDREEENKVEYINLVAEKKRILSKSKKVFIRFVCYGITNNKFANVDYFTLMPTFDLERVYQNFEKVIDFKSASYHEGLLTYAFIPIFIPFCATLVDAKACLKLEDLKWKYCKGCKHFQATSGLLRAVLCQDGKRFNDILLQMCTVLLDKDVNCGLIQELWPYEYTQRAHNDENLKGA